MRSAGLRTIVPVFFLLTAGCGREAIVSTNALPLRRVVLYRNGVGYFERQGHVEDSEVRFKMKETEVGDFLASLAVIERGGSSVRAAAFPLNVDADNEGDDAPKRKKTDDEKKGLKTVVLSLDGRAHDLSIGYIAESPVWRPSYRLVVHPNDRAPQTQGGQDQGQADLQNLAGMNPVETRDPMVRRHRHKDHCPDAVPGQPAPDQAPRS